MSKDQIIREFKKTRDSDKWYSYQYQKEVLLSLAWDLYSRDSEITAEEALAEAHDFMAVFRRDVHDYNTRIYFKD